MDARQSLRSVYASGMLFNICYLTFAVLIPLDALHQQMPVWMVGVLAAIPGVLQLPSRIVSGPLVDWLGERWVLQLTFWLALAAGVVVSVGERYPMAALVAGQLAMGAARGFFWTAAQSEVGRQPGNRAQYLGLFTAYTKGGALIGIAAAGAIAEFLGLVGGFVFAAALALASLAIGLMLPKRSLKQRPASFWSAVTRLGPASVQPFVVVNGLVALLCAIPQALAQSFYPVVLVRAGLPEGVASLITALMSLGMIVAGGLGARALKGLGMKRLVLVSAVGLAASLGATALHSVVLDGAAIAASGFAAGWLNVGFLTAVSLKSHDGDRGTNLGVTQVYFVGAMMVTPLLSGWLLSASGRTTAFLLDGLMALAVSVLVWVLWRWQESPGRTATQQELA